MFTNTQEFKREAQHWLKYGVYTDAPKGTGDYKEYWTEQLKRCREGYSVGGLKITGDHYFYLNFCQIKLTNKEDAEASGISIRKAGKKIVAFPDFWDGDYNYFWCKEIARYGISQEELDKLPIEYGLKELNGGKHLIVDKARRKGFQQPHSEIVITPNGEKTIGDLKVGDSVIDKDGNPTKILEIYPQGKCDVYEIEFHDGRTVKCGKEHLWKIIEFRGKEKVVDTEFFLDKQLQRNKGKSNQYYAYHIPQNNPVKFEEKELPINPYILGLLIGDGSMTQGSLLFSTEDLEILDDIKTLVPDCTISKKSTPFQYSIKFDGKVNPIMRELRKLELACRAEEKYIPTIYKYSSVKQRLELLQGLMDTDGTSSPNGTVRFTTSSIKLKNDVEWLARSLGIKVKTYETLPGKTFAKYISYTLNLVTDLPIFKLERKLKNVRTDRKYNFHKVGIKSVRKLDYQEESSCILVDNSEHLYLTRGFIVTHNSYKNAAIVANIYNTTPNSLSLLTAFDKRYLTMGNAVMNMTTSYLDFINEHTAWTKKRQLNNTADHKKASYLSYINGMPIEKGYKSEVLAISFRDNPDAARGKDATLVLMEEAGKWRGMKDAYASIKPVVQDGDYTTGQIIIFGTGGKNNTDWADFKEMFYNPTTYNLLSFKNIWDGEGQQSCGFFFPDYYNKPGHIDKDGNSNKESARDSEQKLRDHILKTSRRKSDYAEHIAEYCFSPAESFQFTKGKIFNIPELDSHIQYIESHKEAMNFGTPVRLEFEEGKIVKKLDKNLQPVEFPLKDYTEGCIMEYEPPCDDPPYGLYTASLDPIEMEKPIDGDYSLSACIIWKNIRTATESYDLPVATYFGRPERATDCYENIRRLLKYYNAVCLYENEKRGFEWYMSQKGEQYLLKPQPNILNKIIKNSMVNRPYGTHMTDPIKDQCELWGADWLKEEFSPGFLNVTKIPDLFLLKQLSAYEREGNYDAVDAFLFAMLHKQENHYLHKSMTDTAKPGSTRMFFDKVLFNNNKMWNI